MTLALVVATAAGGFFVGVWLRPAVTALASLRGPLQVFAGHVFPHPLDERWIPNGTKRVACGTCVVDWDNIQGPAHRLLIGGVTVATGSRVKRYGRAIDSSIDRRVVAKALEAIP